MPHAITIEIFQLLEEKLGKEEGRKVAEAISLQRKLELKDELTRELSSKADVATAEARLEGKIDIVKIELEAKIDRVKVELDTKLNFLIVLMIIALTLMNPVVAEIIKKALKL